MRLLQRLLLSSVFLGTAAATAGAAEPEKVALCYISADATYGPWFYGQEHGYFKKHGLDTTLTFFDSGTKGMQAMVAGQVDICAADGSALMHARFAGAEAVFVAADLSVLSGNIYGARGITEPSQLKGKKWAISAFGSEAHFAAVLAIKAFGLEPKEVTLVQLGNQGNRFAALDTDQVQASSLLPPVSSKAETAGLPKLAELPKLAPDYFSIGPAVMTSYLRAHRETVKTVLKALAEATDGLHKDHDGGVAVIAKYLKANEKDAEIAWNYYRQYEPADLKTQPSSFEILLRFSDDPQAKTVKSSDLVDLSLLEELDREGFFKGLQ